MSDDITPPVSDETEAVPSVKPGEPDADSPVGDMSVEGETEVGPHPSLTHIENMERADLPAVAGHAAEGKPSPDE